MDDSRVMVNGVFKEFHQKVQDHQLNHLDKLVIGFLTLNKDTITHTNSLSQSKIKISNFSLKATNMMTIFKQDYNNKMKNLNV
jgi:hypothetical protein